MADSKPSSSAFQILPLDTLFFRDPRPFTAGEGTDAQGIFPPTPMAVQGMIRSKLMSPPCNQSCLPYQHKDECPITKVAGKPGGPPGSLLIQGLWLMHDKHWLLPSPLDLICEKTEEPSQTGESEESKTITPQTFKPSANPTQQSNLPFSELRPLRPPEEWLKENKDFSGVSGYLTWEAFEKYLLDDPLTLTPKKDLWPNGQLFLEELRPGIKMEYKRNRVEEGHLYFARHTRLQDHVSLGVTLEGLGETKFAKSFLANFGGEGRGVIVESTSEPLWRSWPDKLLKGITETGRFKLVLTQPAWFREGWLPGWIDKDTGKAFKEVTFTLVAARVERSIKIGGWDLVKKDQKPLRAFVPAGSVYYFQLDNKDHAKVIMNCFWNKSISENPKNEKGQAIEAFEKIGFGHVLVGTWSYAEGG